MIDLGNLSKALTAHKTLVDNYDASNQKAQDLVAELTESKYNTTDLFLQLKEVAEKYAGKQLTDDEELQAGYDELKPITDLCGDFFSEGPSTCGMAGMAVVTDRIREGVEALMALGWTEDDPLIVEANNAMSDDDIIANKIKEALTLKIYEELKSDNPTILQVTDIDENQREIRDSINMTVFIKNPNIYALQAHKGYSEENVPGWIVPTNNGELNTMWRHDLRQIEGLAEDVAFTKYHQETRMEQTITGLPAGIYTVDLNAVNWDEGDTEGGFCYVKTSDTLPVGEGETEDRDINFAGTTDLQFWGQYVGNHDNLIQDVVVTDGILTIGVNFGKGAQYEFDYAKLYLYAPAKDYNYNDAFNRVVTSIDENSKTAKVRALQLYDLNGRRIVTAQKGIQIVKKMMSDGTVKTQKVIK
jgi:methionine-rich copper-binding protein CopC